MDPLESEVAPGDVIFSFREQRIAAIGVARSFCCDCPKPTEFGTIGENWEREGPGWRVDVRYTFPHNIVAPGEHMQVLRPLLPDKWTAGYVGDTRELMLPESLTGPGRSLEARRDAPW